MNNKILNGLRNFTSLDDETFEAFSEILSQPDSTFDSIYPTLLNRIKTVFDSPLFQKNVLSTLEMAPITDLSKEKTNIKNLLDEVDKDESLSENKKNFIHLLLEGTVNAIEQLIDYDRELIPVKIYKLNPEANLPRYAHNSDAGADVESIETVIVPAHQTIIAKTGIAVGIPSGYEIQLRPRSGISAKTNLRIANSVATIDSGYTGEIGVIITNIGDEDYTINKGDKIAQMLIAETPMIKWEEVSSIEELGETERGANGYGSTDKS